MTLASLNRMVAGNGDACKYRSWTGPQAFCKDLVQIWRDNWTHEIEYLNAYVTIVKVGDR